MVRAVIRFTISSTIVVVSAVLAASAQAKPTPTPEDSPIRVETEEVKINVLAYDENRKFVENIRAEDLVITENDVLHQAISFRRIPANVVIVMDTGGALRSAKTIGQTRKTAETLVAALRATDRVAIVQYSDTPQVLSELTGDREAIAAAIARSDFGSGSEFLGAVRLAASMLTREGIENRHMVLITDGTDGALTGSARERALNQVLATDINIHVISYTRMELADVAARTKSVSTKPQPVTAPPTAMPPEVAAGLPNGARDQATAPKIGPTITLDRNTWKRRKADLETAEKQLLSLTEYANGTMFTPTTPEEMVDKTPAVAQFIDSSYVLTYMPKTPLNKKAGDRIITVTSKRPGLVVQAKRKLVVKRA